MCQAKEENVASEPVILDVRCSVVSAIDDIGGPVLLVAVRTNFPCILRRSICLGYR